MHVNTMQCVDFHPDLTHLLAAMETWAKAWELLPTTSKHQCGQIYDFNYWHQEDLGDELLQVTETRSCAQENI